MLEKNKYKKNNLLTALSHALVCYVLATLIFNLRGNLAIGSPLFSPEPIILAEEKQPLNPTGCTLLDMVAFYKRELNIPHAPVTLVRQRMRNPNIHGLTKPINNRYLITLAKGLEPSELRIIIAHELVHVRQFIEGSIAKTEFIKDYLERSFEDEAFRLSLPLAAKFYQMLDCSSTNDAP